MSLLIFKKSNTARLIQMSALICPKWARSFLKNQPLDDIDDVGDSDMMRWMDKGKANLSISFKATSTRAEYLSS